MAIRSAVTISLVPEVRGGPFVFWDDLAAGCRLAAELGFDAVEVFPPAANAIDADQLRRWLTEHHLSLAAVGTGAGWIKQHLALTSGDANTRTQARAFVRSIIDLAGPFGASAIIGSMQGRAADNVNRVIALQYLAESLNELGEHARQYNVPLLYEPINRYETNLVNTVEDGVRLLEGMQTNNVKLLCDLFHMNIEEADLPAALRTGAGRIGHIHFVDSNRRPAGLGHLDLRAIANTLRDIAFDGYVSAEALPYPTPIEAARQTITTFRQLFGS